MEKDPKEKHKTNLTIVVSPFVQKDSTIACLSSTHIASDTFGHCLLFCSLSRSVLFWFLFILFFIFIFYLLFFIFYCGFLAFGFVYRSL
jgi:hypothetical protein